MSDRKRKERKINVFIKIKAAFFKLLKSSDFSREVKAVC